MPQAEPPARKTASVAGNVGPRSWFGAIYRNRHSLSWLLAGLAFVAGSYIGWTTNATFGFALWVASAVLAFLPFLSHRNHDIDGR